MQFFYLLNNNLDYICVINQGEHKGKLCIAKNANEQNICSKIIAFSLEQYNRILFLSSENEGHSIYLSNNPFHSSIFPVGIEGGETPHTIALYDLQNHAWLSFPSLDTKADIAELKISEDIHLSRSSDQKLNWEELKLENIDIHHIPTWLKDMVYYYDKLYDPVPSLTAIKRILFSNYSDFIKHAMLNSLYPTMGVKELDKIVQELKNSPEFKEKFLKTFQKDFWIQNALIPLLKWEENKQNRSIITCDEQYDILQNYYDNHEFSSFYHAINCSYRRTIQPRKKICISTTIRNEGIYILEWIAWYKKLGFEHIFIFSNNNNDGSDDLLKALAEAGTITWINNTMGDNCKPQPKVGKYNFSILPEILDYEWCLFIDVDEFLSINRNLFQNIYDVLDWIERNEVDAVGLNWQYTSSTDSSNYEHELVTQRVQYYISNPVIGLANNIIKTMSKPRYMISSTPHYSVWSYKYHATYRLIQGDIHRYSHNNSEFYSDNPMWADHNHRGIANIIHYRFKSPLEFLLRLYRGNVMHNYAEKNTSKDLFDEGEIYHFNQQHMQYGDKVPSNFLFHENELTPIIDQLLALPNVRSAYDAILNITNKITHEILDYMETNKKQLGQNTLTLLHHILNSK